MSEAPLFFERFEGASGADEEPGAVENVGTGCTIDTGGLLTDHLGWGDFSLRIIRAGTGWEATKHWNLDPITSAVYLHVEMLVDSESLADTEAVDLVQVLDLGASTPPVAEVRLAQISGDLVFQWRVREDGDGGSLTDYNSDPIELDRVYRLDLLYDMDHSRHAAYVDGVEVADVYGITPYTEVDRLVLGAGSGNTQKATTVHYDRITIGDDRWWYTYKGLPVSGELQLTFDEIDLSSRYVRGSASMEFVSGKSADRLDCVLWQGGNRVPLSSPANRTNALTAWSETNITIDDPFDAGGPFGSQAMSLVESSDGGAVQHFIADEVEIARGRTHLIAATVGQEAADSHVSLRLAFVDGAQAFFDLDSGSVASTATQGDGEVIDSGIIDLGSGGYRVWAKVRLPPEHTSANLQVFIVNESFTATYQGDGTRQIEVFEILCTLATDQEGDYLAARDRHIDSLSQAIIDGPPDDAEVGAYMVWEEADGTPYKANRTLVFSGRLAEVEVRDVADTELNQYRVTCFGDRFSSAFELETVSVAADTADAQVDAVVGSAQENETQPSVASRDYKSKRRPEILADIARRAGRVLWLDYGRHAPGLPSGTNWEIFEPGDRTIPVQFQRGSSHMTDVHPKGMNVIYAVGWRRTTAGLRNVVPVRGKGGVEVTAEDATSINTYGERHHDPLDFPEIFDTTDLTNIAEAVRDAKKDVIVEGDSIDTWWPFINPGERGWYTDIAKAIERQSFDVKKVTLVDIGSDPSVWRATLGITTQGLVDLIDPIASKDRPTITDEGDFTVIEAPDNITSPSTAFPLTLGNGEHAIHFRYDSAAAAWRMEFHAGDDATAALIWSFYVFVPSRQPQNLTVTAENVAGEGLGLILTDDNTVRPVVESATDSGNHAGWPVGNPTAGVLNTCRIDFGDAADVDRGEVQLTPSTSDEPELVAITYGDSTIATGVGIGKKIKILLPLTPA